MGIGSISRPSFSMPTITRLTERRACSITTNFEKQAEDVKPLILLAGYSAYPRKVNFRRMKEIADKVGAVFMVDMAHFAGLVCRWRFRGRLQSDARSRML